MRQKGVNFLPTPGNLSTISSLPTRSSDSGFIKLGLVIPELHLRAVQIANGYFAILCQLAIKFPVVS